MLVPVPAQERILLFTKVPVGEPWRVGDELLYGPPTSYRRGITSGAGNAQRLTMTMPLMTDLYRVVGLYRAHRQYPDDSWLGPQEWAVLQWLREYHR